MLHSTYKLLATSDQTPKMKNKASVFFKQIISVVASLIKAKSMAIKGKTNALKTRIIIFGLLRNKKVFQHAVSHKIRALLGHHDKRGHCDDDRDDENKAIVVYNSMANEAPSNPCRTLAVTDGGDNYIDGDGDGDGDDDKYPDLTHSLFDELEFDDGTGSVVDLVKKSREDGSDFNLEDEIDHVADLFIRRFHKQIMMQKQESFKRYKEMLDRGA